MSLPNFVVAGFPKCGSTSLHYYLNEHPEIFMPKQKELHYFTHDILSQLNMGPGDEEVNQFNVKSASEYKKRYKNSIKYSAIGEVSPSYVNYPSRMSKIKEELGEEVKIIILLRDPIKRAYSNYLHLVRESREKLSFFEALQREQERKDLKYSDFWYYAFNSTYFTKVKAFKAEFKNILLIKTEDLQSQTSSVLSEIYSFLEVDETFIPHNIGKIYNPGGVFEENLVTNFFFKQSKIRSTIKKLIPITPGMKHIKQKMINNYKKPSPPIDVDSEDYLVNLLKNDVLCLSKELGLNLKGWNSKFTK